MKHQKCDGFIVEYKCNGMWKHRSIVIGFEDNRSQTLLTDDCAISLIVMNFKDVTEDNIAVIFRIYEWNKNENELEKMTNNTDIFHSLFPGHISKFIIVNENLYDEWLKPEKVM